LRNSRAEEEPAGAQPAGDGGYWFTPLPVYLLEGTFDPASPVNAPAAMLWAHIHRHYAWRRRVFPSYSTLAEETGQSESAVKRQLTALRQAGAITWGATYGPKGRSSNEYALAPMRAFDFDRATAPAVKVKSEPHPPVEVKNDLGVEVRSEPYPQVKNDLGVKSTVEVRTPLSPALPQQHAQAAAAPEERENSAAPDNNQAQQVAAAWTAARGGRRNPAAERDIAASAAELLGPDWPLADLIALAEDMAVKYPTGRNLSRHADHWQPPQPAGVQRLALVLPDWCGQCCNGDDAAATDPNRRWIDRPDGSSVRCHCHPNATRATAA
jgi:hypothetical protein